MATKSRNHGIRPLPRHLDRELAQPAPPGPDLPLRDADAVVYVYAVQVAGRGRAPLVDVEVSGCGRELVFLRVVVVGALAVDVGGLLVEGVSGAATGEVRGVGLGVAFGLLGFLDLLLDGAECVAGCVACWCGPDGCGRDGLPWRLRP